MQSRQNTMDNKTILYRYNISNSVMKFMNRCHKIGNTPTAYEISQECVTDISNCVSILNAMSTMGHVLKIDNGIYASTYKLFTPGHDT
jgi:hypothetical protein